MAAGRKNGRTGNVKPGDAVYLTIGVDNAGLRIIGHSRRARRMRHIDNDGVTDTIFRHPIFQNRRRQSNAAELFSEQPTQVCKRTPRVLSNAPARTGERHTQGIHGVRERYPVFRVGQLLRNRVDNEAFELVRQAARLELLNTKFGLKRMS